MGFSKIKFYVVVLSYIILLLPKGSEAMSMFSSQRNHCGRTSVIDINSKGTKVQRYLPWVVGIVANKGSKNTACSGTVLTPRLVLTSTWCAPDNHNGAGSVIHYGFGRQNKVTKVHHLERSQFVLLEVSQPFRTDFAICLTLGLSGDDLNKTIWTASRITQDVNGAFVPGSLRQEQWTLVRSSPFCESTCETSDERCTCADSNEFGGSTCRTDEGKPVMRWDSRNWYLIGVVSNVNFEGEKCAYQGRRERTFQWIELRDLMKIGKIVKSNDTYYLPLPEKKEKSGSGANVPEPLELCGRAKDVQLGLQKKVAPLLLPWIVAVRAILGAQTVNCAGTIIAPHTVLTAEKCHPKGFENVTYTVIRNSVDMSTGDQIRVKLIHKWPESKTSLLVLVLPHAKGREVQICAPCARFPSGERVVAASWAFVDVGGRLEKNKLHHEEWTLPNDPNRCPDGTTFDNIGPENQTLLCAEARTEAHYVCRGDLGTPVMYWSQGNWCLVGMITHVDVPGKDDCVIRESRKRIFQEFSPRYSR